MNGVKNCSEYPVIFRYISWTSQSFDGKAVVFSVEHWDRNSTEIESVTDSTPCFDVEVIGLELGSNPVRQKSEDYTTASQRLHK